MAKLSKAHQAKFRAAYVRYRELRLEIAAASSALKFANFAKWGGALLLLAWFVRSIAAARDWPSFVGGLALFSAIAGWAYALDKRRELDRLYEEWHEIHQTAKAAGACISDSLGRVKVYAGEIADENVVDPLSDSAYE